MTPRLRIVGGRDLAERWAPVRQAARSTAIGGVALLVGALVGGMPLPVACAMTTAALLPPGLLLAAVVARVRRGGPR